MESKANCLAKAGRQLRKRNVYIMESYSPLYETLSKLTPVVCSEYWDDVAGGTEVNGIRCEDVQRLTFGDNSFDIIISQDVFEHVADPAIGFKEVFRVLKPGGYHIFTVPYSTHLDKSRTRAYLENGITRHLLPPMLHRDGLREDGILVYTDFGLDTGDMLSNLGYEVSLFNFRVPDYRGGYNAVLVCRKPAGQDTRFKERTLQPHPL